MQRDIKERHLLRLGAGEKSLDTDKDFSKWGRVNYALARRMQLLAEVQRLAHSLGIAGDFGFTCETAEYFNLYHVVARWEVFTAALGKVCGRRTCAGVGLVRGCALGCCQTPTSVPTVPGCRSSRWARQTPT